MTNDPNRNRIEGLNVDGLTDYLAGVYAAEDRRRITGALQRYAGEHNPTFWPLLQQLYRFLGQRNSKFPLGRNMLQGRIAHYQNLAEILARLRTRIGAEQNNRIAQDVFVAVHNVVIRFSNPRNFLFLGLQADRGQIPDIIYDSLSQQIQYFAGNNLELMNHDVEDMAANLETDIWNVFRTPLLFVRGFIPHRYWHVFSRSSPRINLLSAYLHKCINSDVNYWQLERGHEEPRIFYHEVIMRLLNSMTRLQIRNDRNDERGGPYFLSVDTVNATATHIVNPFTIDHLVRTLSNLLLHPGVDVRADNNNSSGAVYITSQIPRALRVRFGMFNTTYQYRDGRWRVPDTVTIPHTIWESTTESNPYGPIVNYLFPQNGQILRMTNSIRYRRLQSMMTGRVLIQDNPQEIYDGRTGRRYEPHAGAFFPYFNKTKYDLKRYQIVKNYKELESSVFDDNCLIHALKMSGQLSELELKEMKTSIINRELRPKKMIYYFERLGIQLRIKKLLKSWLMAVMNKEEKLPNHKFNMEVINPKGTRIINLFLICDHFIIDERTPITRFSFENQDQINKITGIKNLQKFEDPITHMQYDETDNWIGINHGKYAKRDASRPTLMSSDLVLELFVQFVRGAETLSPMYYDDVSCLKSSAFKDTSKKRRNIEILDRLAIDGPWVVRLEELSSLNYTQESIRPLLPADDIRRILKQSGTQPKKTMRKWKKEIPKKHVIFYADFEASVADNDGNPLNNHVPFMCCVKQSKSDLKATFCGFDCGKQLLDWLLIQVQPLRERFNKEQVTPLVYFHNLSYDINFLMKYGISKCITRNSSILSAEIFYNGWPIEFKDSYGLLSMSLANMARSFKISVEKEIFPYNYYSPERVEKNIGNINEVTMIENYWSVDKTNQFRQNLLNMHQDPNAFNMKNYCEFYCQRDVDVLQQCVDTFHDQLLSSFDIDCHGVLSISSIADKYLKRTVYYPFGQMYEYSNHIRDFLLDAVHGGRVMCARNERHHFIASDREHGLWDLDAVSLYPSAMSCLYTVSGAPVPLALNELDYNYLESANLAAYVVEIYITKINIPRDFPLVIYKDPRTGKITNTNKPPVRMTVCDIELQDLVEFQQIEFVIIRGLKWEGSRDFRIQNVIRDLFEKRAQYKREKNPLENSYKLLLNSVYGKTIQKPIDHTYEFSANNENIKTWILNHTSYIDKITKIKDSDILKIKRVSPINKHFNNTLLGVQILAMSKRLMNRVMCLADDLHIDVYYQDTDSMHIRRDQVPLLERCYADKYNWALRGSNLCQFHPDFDPITSESVPEEVTAVESYFLGKKCYLDRLVDQRGNFGWHIRMKGVSQESIIHEAQGDLLGLYQKMFEGKTVHFDLCCNGQVKFDNTKDGYVKTKSSFFRDVKATCPMEKKPISEHDLEPEQEWDQMELYRIADLLLDQID